MLSFAALAGKGNWQTERQLRYYKEHSQEFEIFATGTSTTETAIDIRQFKRKAINFGTSSQDLYYSFQIAKAAVSCGGGDSKFRYALIGLTPYSFHYDLSKTFIYKCRVLPYFVAFDDVHNFPVPIDSYKKFFLKDWLTQKPSIAKVNINGVKSQKIISNPLDTNRGIRTWEGKYYPETRDENIKILDDYLTLCEENNICPVMFRSPLTEKYTRVFNKQLFDEFYCLVEQVCQKHPNAHFVDGQKLQEITYEDFYDHQHLNLHGAAKFSSYINDFIEKLEAQGG